MDMAKKYWIAMEIGVVAAILVVRHFAELCFSSLARRLCYRQW